MGFCYIKLYNPWMKLQYCEKKRNLVLVNMILNVAVILSDTTPPKALLKEKETRIPEWRPAFF